MNRTETGAEHRDARGGCAPLALAYLPATGLWAFLLHGFVTTPVLLTLSIFGPASALLGLYLVVAGLRHALSSIAYFGTFVSGIALAVGGAVSLAPQAPASLLVSSTAGWGVLDRRAAHFREALERGDDARAHRLLRRGLGDTAPLNRSGRPLIHDIREPERLAALLALGLDADARDADGRSLLLLTWDEDVARVLLAAGADPDARDDNGRTPLMASADKGPGFVQLLVEAGADVHAVDEAGRSVADLIGDGGEIAALLEAHAGDRPLQPASALDPLAPGRRDWLVEHADASAMTAGQPLRRGEPATLDIRLVNDSDADRLLDVRAELNESALFVEASHGGRIADPRSLNPWQTVRWPLLVLPAHSAGRLSLKILARMDDEAGDLSVNLRAYDRIAHGEEVLQLYQTMSTERTEVDARALPMQLLPGLAAAVVLWVLLRRRDRASRAARPRRFARAAAGLGAALCAGVGTALVLQTVEPFLRFEAATCTVLDRRALARTAEPVQRSRAERMRYGTLRDGRPSRYDVPLVAVRMEGAAAPVLASGFAAGMATPSMHALQLIPLGASLTCWFDPETPTRFTLTRWPDASAILGFGMLVAIALLLGFVARRLGSRARGAPSQ